MKKKEISITSSAAEYLTYVAASGDTSESIEMRYEDENIWLTQKMMATLYGVKVNKEQYDLVLQFLDDPDKYMKDFIKAHPSFIDEQIALGGKTEQRARLAIEKGFI